MNIIQQKISKKNNNMKSILNLLKKLNNFLNKPILVIELTKFIKYIIYFSLIIILTLKFIFLRQDIEALAKENKNLNTILLENYNYCKPYLPKIVENDNYDN